MKLVEKFWNQKHKFKHVRLIDYDKSKMDTEHRVYFTALVLKNVLVLPDYVKIKKIGFGNKEITFSISISDLPDILFHEY